MAKTANTTSSAHTAAPWKMDIQSEYVIVVGADGTRIADVYAAPDTLKDQEALACARLIAAAPELLDVLKAIHNDCDKWLNDEMDITSDLFAAFLEETGNAIAKAEGDCSAR